MEKKIITETKYKKRYKCPYCEDRIERNKMAIHIEKKHKDVIPEGYTAARIAFNTVNKKSTGHCIICKNDTSWNEDKCRYERLCDNPACKKAYIDMTEERLKARRGITKSEMLNDPEFQNKMLKGRSISGIYKFSDGNKIDYVGSYEKNFLEFMDKFLHVKSSDIEAPGPTIEYYYEGKKHFWITDFYYIPYNLVLDIKDGGNNPNKREMPEYRAKQKAKEKAITDMGVYNYIRLTDNNMPQLIDIMMDLKDSLIDVEGPYDQRMSKIKPIIRINEGYIHLLNDFKDPRFCDWDEELTYKSIKDAIHSQNGLNLDNELHVYDMNPETYKKEYIGSIRVQDNDKYEWIKQESILVEDTSCYSHNIDYSVPRMLCIMMTDPETYISNNLFELEKYVSDISDIYEIIDISTYIKSILQEHSERWIEYHKYLYSGKCSFEFQHDCEIFKKRGITLEDLTEVGDKLRNINHIINDKIAECNSYIEISRDIDDFDLEYMKEYVL